MAKINQQPPRGPAWPWGGPRNVREKLVDPLALDRKKKLKKLGNPKNPALASSALLESIAPAHSSEELRLPLPPQPRGREADVEFRLDYGNLDSVAQRGSEQKQGALERGLSRISAPPDRMERMKALLSREGQMLQLIAELTGDVKEIQRRMREEQAGEGI
jgi:hypothetical protein